LRHLVAIPRLRAFGAALGMTKKSTAALGMKKECCACDGRALFCDNELHEREEQVTFARRDDTLRRLRTLRML